MNIIKWTTLIVCLFFELFIPTNAQEVLNIHQNSGSLNNYKIYDIDSITYLFEGDTKIINIYSKPGKLTRLDVSTIDSLTFEKKSLTGKQGFVLFRVDDTHPSSELIPLSRVFDKFGYKMVSCFNPSLADKDAIQGINVFQMGGHEITDHTPNHTTAYADLKTQAQVNQFVGRPGVEKIDGFRVYFDWTFPEVEKNIVENELITVVGGTSIVRGNLTKITSHDLVYTSEFGWILLRNITPTEAIAMHAKSRKDLIFKNSSTEQLYKVDNYQAFPTVDGMNSLMLASKLMFEYIGIDYFKYWCMCGGPWAMGRGDIIREAGTSLGYVGGSEHSSPNGNIPLTYNQSNNLGKWASQVETVNLENMTPTQCIKIIANNVSKHLGVIITDHMWYKDSTYTTLYTGSKTKKFSQYLKNVEDVLQFCNDNDIQVVTYKDVLKSLYETTPDPHLNILPPLYADLTNQGYPDGYSLSAKTTLVKNDGVAEDHNYSLCKNGDGSIFYIENIGGFEKGENVLSFYAKGADNAVVQLNINNPKVDLTYQKVVVPIKGATNSFVKFKTKLNIPSDVDLLTLRFYVSNNTSKDFYISGLYIGKED